MRLDVCSISRLSVHFLTLSNVRSRCLGPPRASRGMWRCRKPCLHIQQRCGAAVQRLTYRRFARHRRPQQQSMCQHRVTDSTRELSSAYSGAHRLYVTATEHIV